MYFAPADGVPLGIGYRHPESKNENDGTTRWLKRFQDRFSHLDTIPASDGRTLYDSKDRAMESILLVKMVLHHMRLQFVSHHSCHMCKQHEYIGDSYSLWNTNFCSVTRPVVVGRFFSWHSFSHTCTNLRVNLEIQFAWQSVQRSVLL